MKENPNTVPINDTILIPLYEEIGCHQPEEVCYHIASALVDYLLHHGCLYDAFELSDQTGVNLYDVQSDHNTITLNETLLSVFTSQFTNGDYASLTDHFEEALWMYLVSIDLIEYLLGARDQHKALELKEEREQAKTIREDSSDETLPRGAPGHSESEPYKVELLR